MFCSDVLQRCFAAMFCSDVLQWKSGASAPRKRQRARALAPVAALVKRQWWVSLKIGMETLRTSRHFFAIFAVKSFAAESY